MAVCHSNAMPLERFDGSEIHAVFGQIGDSLGLVPFGHRANCMYRTDWRPSRGDTVRFQVPTVAWNLTKMAVDVCASVDERAIFTGS